jgi:hypothetical protein
MHYAKSPYYGLFSFMAASMKTVAIGVSSRKEVNARIMSALWQRSLN